MKRAATLLSKILTDCGKNPLKTHARALSIPRSTAYRTVETLVSNGILAPIGGGRFVAAFGLIKSTGKMSPNEVLSAVCRPIVRRLSRESGATAHLGVLDGDMVTYILKEERRLKLFTREGRQLEAYCSAIGKVLLAHMPEPKREAYLEADCFVALTPHTIVSPQALRAELAEVARLGYALDREEVAEGMVCQAVPIRYEGSVMSAISLSRIGDRPCPDDFAMLRQCADRIEDRLS